MATKIKDSHIRVSEDPLIEDIVKTIRLSEDEVDTRSFDHCHTKEELKFEIFSIYMQEGHAREEAEELSDQMAEDLWEHKG